MPRAIIVETPFIGPTSVSSLVLASFTISCSSLNRAVPSSSL
uniref:Uncharacterized protein n=1 Tax=Rhizophora mucronata TaxID=61149 RepID=A0A2P2IVZ6_RHIMU